MIPRYIVSCPTPHHDGWCIIVVDRRSNDAWIEFVSTNRREACAFARKHAEERAQQEHEEFAFLDLEDTTPAGEAMPAVSAQRVASLDVDEEPGSEPALPCADEMSGEGEVLATEAAQS